MAKGHCWKIIRDEKIPLEGSWANKHLWTRLQTSSKMVRDQHVTLGKILGENIRQCSFVAMNRDSQVIGVIYCKDACGTALEIENAQGQR